MNVPQDKSNGVSVDEKGIEGISLRHLPARKLAVIEATGKPTAYDFKQCTLNMLGHSAWQPGWNVLVDYRRLTNFGFSTEGIRDINLLFRQYSREMGDGRCAVVVPSIFVLGLFNMWKPWLPDELQWEVRAFRKIDEACLWLGVNCREL